MFDAYGRNINYLRVSVTDRCNFRCVYCLPPDGIQWLKHADILTYEELIRLITIFNQEGITRVRLTGGEPLIRKNIEQLIAAIAGLGVIADLSMTTNGSLLPNLAGRLKAAGLDRVNISLDTVNSDSFTKITISGCLEDTLQGIKSALTAGLTPVKLNVVLTEYFNEQDLDYFINLVYNFPIAVRFIEYMPFSSNTKKGPDIDKVKELLSQKGYGKLERSVSCDDGGPAKYYSLPQGKGNFGFITPLTEHFCGSCNRLRLTADGRLKPCLLSDVEFDIKTPLRAGATDKELAELFRQAVRAKPAGHCLLPDIDKSDFHRCMCQIGG